MSDIEVIGNGLPDGLQIGRSDDLISMFGATPVAQRADASQVAITDSTTGTVSNTFAAGVGMYYLTIPIHNLATVADGDVLTTMAIPHKFKILSVDAYVTNEVTTGSKATSLNVEIGTTNLTGGVVALTSANCATLGAKVAGSAVTAANTGAAADTISIEASSTTAFVEGGVVVVIGIQNMDTADMAASIADKWNELRAALVAFGPITGAA